MGKKKLAFDDVAYILPSDILFLILIKVPSVKSLLRFKSISKSWNIIISDNEFKRTHRDQSKALGREKLVLHKSSTNEFEFRDLESSQLVMMAKEVFTPKKFRKAIVLSSCDGLLLLRNPTVLWNPSTGEYQTLTCPYFNYKGKVRVPNACGLCYDSSVDDYKVILIYKSSYALYSLNNDCWAKKQIPLRGVTSTIIYFDEKSDELKELPLPDFVREDDCFGLTTLKSCLSFYGGNDKSLVLDIWIMERDGSWKWLMNVCNLPCICEKFIEDIVLLGCTRNGEIVFQGLKTSQLFIYNPSQQLLTETQISKDFSKNGDLLTASVCLDSLYFKS
ncbi:hypothetical protein BC332_33467 [Capsicum chinense]|nr:hypothetical protein BC332_33467 [Capsicum chinense]